MNNIVITGGTSMVGKHLKKYLPDAVYLSSRDYDLTNESHVKQMYADLKPKTVIHLAAKVGGIIDNINKPVQYFEQNMLMNTFMVKYAYENNVKNFMGMLSTCIYPDILPGDHYPLTEYSLHLGPPTATNFSYGYAKRCMAVHIDSYNKQYKTNYNYLIPCNLYSEHDNFNDAHSHYVTSLIYKIATAKLNKQSHINLFGSGKPLRQFMYTDDLAKIIYTCVQNDIYHNFNVATDEVLTIKEIAQVALKACNAEDLTIVWDSSKPDGQYRKDVSNEKLKLYIKDFTPTPLVEGIQKTFKYYYEMAAK